MNVLRFLALPVVAACFISCSPKNTNSPNLIVGTWHLQHEHAMLYEDSVKIMDTVYNASAVTYGTAEFNANGTFTSSSVLTPAGNSLSDVPSTGNTEGTYSYSANAFTTVPGLAAWFSYAVGSSSGPIDESSSEQVTMLTSSNLDIHAAGTFGITNSTGLHIYSETIDYYYIR